MESQSKRENGLEGSDEERAVCTLTARVRNDLDNGCILDIVDGKVVKHFKVSLCCIANFAFNEKLTYRNSS